MIHHPSKFHPTSLSQFLALHSSSPKLMPGNIDMDNSSGPNQSSLEAISGNIGKSFTIAAILGLKKNAAAMEHHHHLHSHHHMQQGNVHKDYAAVMNLSINQQNVKNCMNNNFDNEHNGVINSGCNRLPTVLAAANHHSTNHSNNALQSLQHLHHQHTHSQSGMSFPSRERSKNGMKLKNKITSKFDWFFFFCL